MDWRHLEDSEMRRTLVCLAACALLTPLAAQEKVPAPTTGTTVAPAPMTMSRSTRSMTRRGEVVVMPGTMTTTTIVNGQTQTMTMEPVVDSRGRVRGFRQVMTPSTTVTKSETKSETNPVTQTGNSEPKVEKSETKVTTTQTTEQPAPERRRGFLSRIFRR
ncbi:MAG: hypothetical protein JNJ77_04405 [Planctomycetia bacterium]|nr:hypothetical protein [Planctomycetia bacterium]